MAELRPFAKRPYNQTVHDELKDFRVVRYGEPERAPHLMVTTSTGKIEVLPLSDEKLLALHSQISDLAIEHLKKYVEGK
jgi:hypothetical protein